MRLHRQINETVRALTITPEHLRTARGNGMHFVAEIPVEKFLELTTTNDEGVEHIRAMCKTVDDYNRYATTGNEEGYKNVIMPFLDIDTNDLRIHGHEGRHRAAALMCAGARTIPIAIKLRPNDRMKEKYGVFDAKYSATAEDMPYVVQGEFGRGILRREDLRIIHPDLREVTR